MTLVHAIENANERTIYAETIEAPDSKISICIMQPTKNSGNQYWCFCQDFKRAGISRLLKEKGREQFWQKKCNLRRTRKNLKNRQNFTPFRVNKMFSLKRHFRWLPDGAGIIITNKIKK
jgi:hypothetical protein